MSTTRPELPAPPIRVIDSLAFGFETVAGRLPLVVLPLILDLLLWAGPRMSVQKAFEAAYQNTWLPLVAMQPAEMQELADPLTEQLKTQVEESAPQYLPVVSALSKDFMGDVLLLGVPSLIVRQEATPLPFDYRPPILDVRSVFAALGIGLLLPVGWSLFGVIYRSMVAQQVRDDRVRLLALVRSFPIHWFNLMGFLVLLVILAMIVIAPFLMLSMVLFNVSLPIAVAAINVGLFVVIWLAIFCSFTVHGVLLNERWVLRALWDSIRVVQWNLSSTTFLWILVVGLNLGLSSLFTWAGLTTDVWFVVPAIAVHAFLNTALVSATFIYFKDRYRHWHQMRAIILESLDRRLAQAAEQPENETFDTSKNALHQASERGTLTLGVNNVLYRSARTQIPPPPQPSPLKGDAYAARSAGGGRPVQTKSVDQRTPKRFSPCPAGLLEN